jgi:hypothetical protein
MGSRLSPIAQITSFPPQAVAVTPDDNVIFEQPSTIYVGGAGNVQVLPAYPTDGNGQPNGSAVVFSGLPAGSVIPCLVSRVYATNTTATLLVRVF